MPVQPRTPVEPRTPPARSVERRPHRRAEEAALPLVAQLEGVVHPAARDTVLGADLAAEQRDQALGPAHPLPQDDLAVAARAERGAERGDELQQAAARCGRSLQRVDIERA